MAKKHKRSATGTSLPFSDGSSDDSQESFIETLRRNDQELAYRLTRLDELEAALGEKKAIQARIGKWLSDLKLLCSNSWRSEFKKQCKRMHLDFAASLAERLHEREARRKQLAAEWDEVNKKVDEKFTALELTWGND